MSEGSIRSFESLNEAELGLATPAAERTRRTAGGTLEIDRGNNNNSPPELIEAAKRLDLQLDFDADSDDCEQSSLTSRSTESQGDESNESSILSSNSRMSYFACTTVRTETEVLAL